MYIDYSVVICAGAATEVEALRKALGEAEEKVVQQQAARKKLKARVKEVQQELQDAVKNARPWSMMRRFKGPNLRESWIRGSSDSRTISFRRTVGL